MRRARFIVSLGAALLVLTGCAWFQAGGPAILYEETFSGSTTPWYTGETDSRRIWLEGGAYHMLVKEVGLSVLAWRQQVGPFADFQLDLDTEQLGGPDNNGYGVNFRMVDGDNYYRFRISGDGYARFDKRVAGAIVVVRPWEAIAAIHQGNAANHLTIVADGSELTFFVNGTEVYSLVDTDFAAGHVGLSGIVFEAPGQAHIAFDNLIVQELE